MKVYHLHLPRTSGVFLRNSLRLQNSICGHNFRINPEDFKTADYAIGHYGIEPAQYADFSFAILRNPVERTISYFKYINEHLYRNFSISEVIDMYINDPRLKKSIENLSNKFLTGRVDFDLYNQNIRYPRIIVENGWYLKDYSNNYSDSFKSIKNNKINLLYFDDPNLYDKISDIYNIKIDKDKLTDKNNVSLTNSSKNYEIPKRYYSILENINGIDMEMYDYFKK